jgi:DNA-binding Lrp family transcriptional regulator
LPSVVRARTGAAGPAARAAQFEKAARPLASMARQLGISSKEAGEILRRLVDDDKG